MDIKREIIKEIDRIKSDEGSLYSYLYDLVYNEVIDDVSFLQQLYTSFLDDERSEIKRVAIYALLFGLKIKANSYRDFSLNNIKDLGVDLDLRLTCALGISHAYFATKDKTIMGTLVKVFNNGEDDENIRVECFSSLMKVLGLSSQDIIKKNQSLIVTFDDINLDKFAKELQEVNQIIK